MLALRRPVPALLATLSVCLALTWLLGVMRITDVRLDFMSTCVLTLVLGYGIDDAIHLTHRALAAGSAGHGTTSRRSR